LGDAEKGRSLAVDLSCLVVTHLVALLLLLLGEHVVGAHLLEHLLVLGVKYSVQGPRQALEFCGGILVGEEGEDGVEEGGLGDGDVALPRDVDALPICLRFQVLLRLIILFLFLVGVVRRGHAVAGARVGAEGLLELDGGELQGGKARRSGGRTGNGGRRRRGEGKRDGIGAQEEGHRGRRSHGGKGAVPPRVVATSWITSFASVPSHPRGTGEGPRKERSP
jgi:hypothetical protein